MAFLIVSAPPALAMNRNVVHRTPLDVAADRAVGLARVAFARGLFRTRASSATLESGDIESPTPFDNLVGSLSAEVPPGGSIELLVKVRGDAGWSGWYSLGTLRADGFSSAPGVDDARATLAVDELKLKSPATAARYKLKFRAGRRPVFLRSVSLALSNGDAPAEPPAASTGPWTRELAVAPRSQMDAQDKYKHDICSPTSLSMVLSFWGHRLGTEEVALAVRDRTSQLFGNWSANADYAGLLGLDARVARLQSLTDLEAEIAAGRPVAVSVTFGEGELPGSPMRSTGGHLMVVVGFTPKGDVIALDPAGRAGQERRVYARAAFHKVWRVNKRGLAYLIGPDFPRRLAVGAAVADLWSKPTARKRVHLADDAHLSQLLYGERVTALESRGDWVRLSADEQEALDSHGKWGGYRGWVRADALVCAEPPPENCAVRTRQAIVHVGRELMTLSVGTRLDRLSQSSSTARVLMLDGSAGEIAAADLYSPPPLPTESSRAEIIRAAELFLGTSYYWGGRSGVQADPSIGVDCSGLVSLAYRVHGRDVPRDSHEQYLRARPVRRAELKPGDLVFLTRSEDSERVTHVMIYTGGDGLIESRQSSGRVLRTTFLERFGAPLIKIESGDAVLDLSFAKPRRRRIFFGSYF